MPKKKKDSFGVTVSVRHKGKRRKRSWE